MSPILLELIEPLSAMVSAVDPQIAKNRISFYIMTGVMVLLPLVSGVLIYYSINFPHTQHGHDDH